MSKYSDYLKQQKENNIEFYKKMYDGLDLVKKSNKYCQINKRVADDESKVVINVNSNHIFKTQYGYGFIVGNDKVVWLKNWQVLTIADWYETEMSRGCYQVMLSKDYYKVNQSTRIFDNIIVGDTESDSDFEKENGYHSWEDIVNIAKKQESLINECPIIIKL